MKSKWQQRKQRPLPESVQFTLSKFNKIWATWLFYAVLMDLGDAVADDLALPADRISLEMIYRGLYHFSLAHQKGLTDEPIQYFAAPENRDLGVVKSIRKPRVRLIYCPIP